jgi:hypothetical protein
MYFGTEAGDQIGQWLHQSGGVQFWSLGLPEFRFGRIDHEEKY